MAVIWYPGEMQTPRCGWGEMRCNCRDLDGGETRHGWGEMLISGPGWK